MMNAVLLGIVSVFHSISAINIVDDVLVRDGESAILGCPFYSSSHITWFGPPNFTVYADGSIVNSQYTQIEIKEMIDSGQFYLKIRNVTKPNIGSYRCSTIANNRIFQKDFILILKRPPRNLQIKDKESGNFIRGTESQELTLTCDVDGGDPLPNLVWKQNGSVLTQNQTDSLRYSFFPEDTYHLKVFKCFAYHPELSVPLEDTVQILLKYKPRVQIAQGNKTYIIEGKTLKLNCIVDSIPHYNNISWIWENGATIQNSTILNLQLVNRREAGTYTCSASNTIGTGSTQIYVSVLYPPDMSIDKVIANNSMTLKCIARGIPSNESFYDWQHLSEQTTLIRRIPSTNGTLNIIRTTYATNGRYVCTSTNGIPDVNGVKNKSASIDINDTDIPIFVSDNEDIQYAKIHHDVMLTVNIYSYPPLLAVRVENDYGIIFKSKDSFVYRYIWVTDTIFGTKVDLKGTSVSLKLQNVQNQHFGNYTFFVKNQQGDSNFTVRLMPADLSFRLWFLILAPGSVGVCIIIIALVICVRRQFKIYILQKQRHSFQQQDHVYFEIDERNEVQNVIETGINDTHVDHYHTSQEEIDTAIDNEHNETSDVTFSDEDGTSVCNKSDSEESKSTSGSSDEILGIRAIPEEYSHPYHTLVKENRLSAHEYESLKKRIITGVNETLKKCPRRNSI